jgi:hypothetical protein
MKISVMGGASMSPEIVAYCGLICSECPAFIATRENDLEKLEALALEWYSVEGDSSYCLCDGCNVPGRKNNHCSNCAVRSCAVERGVANCAHCVDYGCDTLTELITYIPAAGDNLERIRASL